MNTDIFDLHRMDDDGYHEPHPDILPFRIGIPAEPVQADPFDEFSADESTPIGDGFAEDPAKCILQFPTGTSRRDETLRGLIEHGRGLKPFEDGETLSFGNGSSVEFRPEPTPEPRPALYIPGQGDGTPPPTLVATDGKPLNPLDWSTYLAWRKTKCRPFDREELIVTAESDPAEGLEPWVAKARLLEEIDQATHEVVGEVAEIGELFEDNGPFVFLGEFRDKLIDECGDVFFCAAWALDAWGVNPLYEVESLELVALPMEHPFRYMAGVMAAVPFEQFLAGPLPNHLAAMVHGLLLSASVGAGLTANAFKKLRFQRREQDADTQAERLGTVICAINNLLILAGSSVEEALKSNMRKLDARFPEGYKPGVGGGIRTGEGA